MKGEKSGEFPHVLKRLVFSALLLSHGQGFVERGFNTSKWILKGNRGSMSLESFTAQKRMKDMCEKYRGAGQAPLSHNLLVEITNGCRTRKSRKRLKSREGGKRKRTLRERERLRKRKQIGMRNIVN